jgi:hypothetical protein
MGKLDADGGNEEAAEMAVPFGQPFCSNKLSVVAVAEHFSDRDGAKTEVLWFNRIEVRITKKTS